jgi:DNA-binding NtrC family response regulator
MTQTILIVDDDPVQRRLLETCISRSGQQTLTAPGGGPALEMLLSPKGEQISLVLLDLMMPDVDGIQVLTKLRATNPDLPVIVLTAKGGIDSAVEAMRAGANDFLVKPTSPERIKVSIQNALKLGVLTGEVSRLKKKQQNQLGFADLVGKSFPMRQVIRLGERAAQSSIPILIEGESGVGKELIARAIQGCSERAGKPFVTLNCGAIPENLIESILFGHEKGAFTGASDKHLGKFQEADGGTLFLDEIGELDPLVQAKLLRVLESREVLPLGASRPRKVTFGVCVASHKRLRTEVAARRFREDLYFRIGGPEVRVPPLRERLDEIPRFIDRVLRAVDPKLAASVLFVEACALRAWPGNVRELLQGVRHAAHRASEAHVRVVEPEHLPGEAGERLAGGPPPEREERKAAAALRSDDDIRRALADNDGNVRGTARALGMHRNQLRRWMEKNAPPGPKD